MARRRLGAALAGVLVVTLCGCSEERQGSDLAGLRVGSVLSSSEYDEQFDKARVPRAFRFPEDHGAHPGYRSEWWYVTAALETAEGREFGVQFTIFRQALFNSDAADDPWRNGQMYLAHVALTDVAAREHVEAERLARGHPELAGVSGDPPSVHVEGWRLSFNEGAWSLDAGTDAIAIDLKLRPQRPVVPQGDGGLSAKGPGQASYYYSVPRLAAAGELRHGRETYAVSGLAWLDREWSTSVLAPEHLGWDWFGLMLESGEDVMVFRLRRQDGERDGFDHGVLVTEDGAATQLGVSDFELEPLDYWVDERDVRWPVRWRLTLACCEWTVHAALDDQRMDTLLTYWEGLVRVTDVDGRQVGKGYMELTGYR